MLTKKQAQEYSRKNNKEYTSSTSPNQRKNLANEMKSCLVKIGAVEVKSLPDQNLYIQVHKSKQSTFETEPNFARDWAMVIYSPVSGLQPPH